MHLKGKIAEIRTVLDHGWLRVLSKVLGKNIKEEGILAGVETLAKYS